MMAQSTPKKKPRLIGRQASGFLTQLEQIVMQNELLSKYPKDFRKDFAGWLAANHQIYAEFERQARLIASRRNHYSARTIAEVIRHNSQMSEVGGEWKINNNRIPDMARLFALRNPQHSQLFQLRNSDMRLGRAA